MFNSILSTVFDVLIKVLRAYQAPDPNTNAMDEEVNILLISPTNSSLSSSDLLRGMDIFILMADLDKEPPLLTTNTIISILVVGYPVKKFLSTRRMIGEIS